MKDNTDTFTPVISDFRFDTRTVVEVFQSAMLTAHEACTFMRVTWHDLGLRYGHVNFTNDGDYRTARRGEFEFVAGPGGDLRPGCVVTPLDGDGSPLPLLTLNFEPDGLRMRHFEYRQHASMGTNVYACSGALAGRMLASMRTYAEAHNIPIDWQV